MKTELAILYLEDNLNDAELVKHQLKHARMDFNIKVTDNKNDFEKFLDESAPDIILADHALPQFDSLQAIEICKERALDEVPFILVTGAMPEEFAVACLEAGVDDYVLKNNLIRLPGAIKQALARKHAKSEFGKAFELGQQMGRKRIMRDLHDGLGQNLAALRMILNTLDDMTVDKNEIQQRLFQKLHGILEHASKEFRAILKSLTPHLLEKEDLLTALRIFCEYISGLSKVKIEYSHEGFSERIASPVEVELYRIVQEIINNIIKHARATRVSIHLMKKGSKILLQVKDNGVGFNPDKYTKHLLREGMGLGNIRERVEELNGQFDLQSIKGKGTQIRIIISLDKHA